MPDGVGQPEGDGTPEERFTYSAEIRAAVVSELTRRATEDKRLTGEAARLNVAHRRQLVAECRRENGRALRGIVEVHGWPSRRHFGDEATTAALMIVLHADDLQLQLQCRDLIAEAANSGDLADKLQLAYVVDLCAVAQGEAQSYGTRIDPQSGQPFPISDEGGVDERRRAVGLRSLAEQMAQIRAQQQGR
ncbi:DUF6624 domain-containing protein [Streptomyces sp. NPDC050095]|uniref:DUF6624 domain-containing protein n=1 Tax=unclassified Streptomyces TaxID=2593676 RepID=UPI00341DDD65